MTLQYIGAPTFREVVEKTHRRIFRDYTRRYPKIVVGLQAPLEPHASEYIVYKVLGFHNWEEYNSYVDKIAKNIIKLTRHSAIFGKDLLHRKIRAELGKLKEASFHYKGSIDWAFYWIPEDATYCDPRSLIRYTFNLQRADEPDFEELLKHEMVHNDVGDTVFREEVRQNYLKAKYILYHLNRAKKATERGEEEFKKWSQEEGIQQFFESLTTEPEDILGFAKTECKRLQEESDWIGSRTKNLGIEAADEALAYNFSGGGEEFKL